MFLSDLISNPILLTSELRALYEIILKKTISIL